MLRSQIPIPSIPITNHRVHRYSCATPVSVICPPATNSATIDVGDITLPTPNVTVEAETLFKDIRCTSMVDDVNGDGSNLIPYISATQICIDNSTGSPVLTTNALGDFTDGTLQTPYTATNGVDPDSIGQDILGGEFVRINTICMIDDVNGDSSELVKYFEASKSVIIGTEVITEPLGAFTNELLELQYNPTNPTNPQDIGNAPILEQRRILLQNNTWSPTALTTDYAIRVDVVADPLTPPTFTDSQGVITTLRENEFLSFADDIQSDNILLDTNIVVTSGFGDSIYISYKEINSQ